MSRAGRGSSSRDGAGSGEGGRYHAYTERSLEELPQVQRLPAKQRHAMRVVAQVLPFRVNNYVVEQLIDWDDVPNDPMFQLTFPQRGMLAPHHFTAIEALLHKGGSDDEVKALAHRIRMELNPHPGGQRELNVPHLDHERLAGLQHKYRETVLFFPSQGQTCHAYCSFCFRWAQFVGERELRFAANEADELHAYLAAHQEVSDLLITGGDPMVMKTSHLAGYLAPLLTPQFDHVQNLRIGTKAISYWPQRFVSDDDADELLRLLEGAVAAGRHVAIMAHFNHWRELETPLARQAIRRIQETGAVIRTQSPLVAHINDDPQVWARLWREQTRLGLIPYYMFVERDTGASRYFEVPLARAWEIYREAIQQVSGLSRTVRGPSMSAGPGKVEVQGVAEVAGEKVFVLRFIQGRDPEWVERPFFARYDAEATWLTQLQPAFGEARFFYEEAFEVMKRNVMENGS